MLFVAYLQWQDQWFYLIDGKLKRTMVKVLKHNEEFRKNVYNLDLQTFISYTTSLERYYWERERANMGHKGTSKLLLS